MTVPVHVNPDMFRQRGEILKDGVVFPHVHIPSIEALEQAGGNVQSSSASRLLLDNTFYLSGEIPRTTNYEKGIPIHVRRNANDSDWEPDPLILDERYLAINIRDKDIDNNIRYQPAITINCASDNFRRAENVMNGRVQRNMLKAMGVS